jgi:DNA-binding beta-propeller fold protein YncE
VYQTDADGNVYVAVAVERLVLKVQSDGKKTVAARSPSGWAPSGGMFDRDGNLWLLEYSVALFKPAQTRVRRIDRNGQEHTF